jgi:hypothetical protein
LQQLSRTSKLSQSIEDFLQEFLELLVHAAKCLRSKIDERDYQNSTKIERHLIEKIRLEVNASLPSLAGEREADLKYAHSVEHVKEKGESSSSDIRLKNCEQSQNLVESNEETRIAYVDQLYTSKYKKFLYYRWIKKSIASRVVRRTNSTSSCKFQGVGASCNLKYIPTTCTSIENIVLE